MKKNDSIELVIEDMGTDGEGIGHVATEDGRSIAVFVKNAVMGDTIRAAITKVKKQYVYARLVEVIKPSPYRVEPKCPVARPCGGCTLQHVSYEKQLDYKWNKVKNCLSRIGGIEHPEDLMEPIIGMENPWNYRNKAQFPVGRDKDGKVVTGFYAGRTHTIIDTPHCDIQAEGNDTIIKCVRDFLQEYNISTYDEETHTGLMRHILTRVGFTTGEIMVCLIINGTKLPHADVLVERLRQIDGMTSISININQEKTNRILGDTCKTLWGQDYITDYIGDVKYQISPLSFYQVNPVQTKKLYDKALEYANLQGGETVWDLYCGIGTISLFLSKKAAKVYGVEIVPQAIADAKVNAQINGIENVQFFVGKAEEVLPAEYKEHGVYADVIVVDPPRKGCDETLLQTIADMQPKRMVYVSCDPATLARDVKRMGELGYQVKKVAVVDQFCQGGHVETVVLLSHKKPDSVINVKVEFGEGEGKIPLDNIEKRAESYKPKERVTYKMIKEYIEEKYGFKVHTAYIAEVKRDLGLPMYDAPNAVEELKQPRKHPTPEKVEAIKDALKHFEII